jgi:hypothetical protein
MLQALKSAEGKLREYYAMTSDQELGDIYAHGTILAPQHKIQFFQTDDWSDDDYATQYLSSLKDRMKAYQANDDLTIQPKFLLSGQATELDKALEIDSSSTERRDELTEYLKGGMINLIYFHLIYLLSSDLFAFI